MLNSLFADKEFFFLDQVFHAACLKHRKNSSEELTADRKM
jgi:hypothetical protein